MFIENCGDGFRVEFWSKTKWEILGDYPELKDAELELEKFKSRPVRRLLPESSFRILRLDGS